MILTSYSIDGIPLENPALGWVFRGASKPLAAHTVRRGALQLPGRPGTVPDADAALTKLEAPVPTLVVQTPRENYSALLSLIAEGTVLSATDMPQLEAPYQLLSASPEEYGPGGQIVDLTVTVEMPGVFWRDKVEKTTTAALNAGSVAVEPWAMDGLVSDAIVRVRGPVSGVMIRSRSAYLSIPGTIPAGSYLRYECATGRAFITTTDTWVGGTPAAGQVFTDGPGDLFAIFPSRVDLLSRVARLTVDTASRGAGAQIDVRGKGAYIAF